MYTGMIMTGVDYEDMILSKLQSYGFKAHKTGKEDGGVDIIASITVKDVEYTFNIQCKYWNKAVDNKPIQEVFSGTTYHKNGGRPVVITNNEFTVDARLYADKLQVELIGRPEWIAFDTLVKTGKLPLTEKKGLFGLILGIQAKQQSYMEQAIRDNQVSISDIKDTSIEDINNSFDIVKEYYREAAELQQKAADYQQKALQIQRKTIIKSLNHL